MNYIYDITVNFNDVYYDFFEWSSNDYIIHLRKIPIYKVSNNDYQNILNNNIMINNDILSKIKNKTEIYGKNSKKITACLFCNNENIVALKFNDNGYSEQISSLIVEEELDILESSSIKVTEFDYKILKSRKIYLQTRIERKNKHYIQTQINNLNIDNDQDKIKYLYFEYFNKFNSDVKDALTKLKKLIDKEGFDENLKYFLRLCSHQK